MFKTHYRNSQRTSKKRRKAKPSYSPASLHTELMQFLFTQSVWSQSLLLNSVVKFYLLRSLNKNYRDYFKQVGSSAGRCLSCLKLQVSSPLPGGSCCEQFFVVVVVYSVFFLLQQFIQISPPHFVYSLTHLKVVPTVENVPAGTQNSSDTVSTGFSPPTPWCLLSPGQQALFRRLTKDALPFFISRNEMALVPVNNRLKGSPCIWM